MRRLDRRPDAIELPDVTAEIDEDLPDETVEQICRAVVARRDSILLQDGTPLPSDQTSAFASVPLHRAAERFWTTGGYR